MWQMMFKWLRPTKNAQRISSKLGDIIRARQRRYAELLQSKTSRISKNHLRVGFLVFCIIYASAILYSVRSSYSEPHHPLPTTSITVPAHINVPSPKDPLKSKSEQNRIEKFSRYLDSLAVMPEGLLILDSIRLSRPGLIDSVNAALEMFNSSK